ncbi:MAG: lipid A deacylase LpxR family protein [Bacteroidota bacterium]|nr:lipid A deacylase LpxR family protein [Bacteroidota bacterium]
MKHFYLLIILGSIGLKAFSQTADSMVVLENYIKLNYENDFFTATDRYYTQGIQLTFIHPTIKYSPISKTLVRFKKATSNYYGATLEQNCFTPRSIRHLEGIYYGERPYTGTFFLSHHLASLNYKKQMALKTQIDLGGIGKCAKCEDEQKAIHRGLVNIQPLGWEYQLKNDIYLNYKFAFEKGIINSKFFQAFAQSSLRFGTIYNDLSAGLNIRMGLFSNYFKNLGLEKNYSKSNAPKLRAYVVVKSNTKAVAYNATLQGGAFTKNNIYILNSDQITKIVYDAGAYVVLAYKHFGVEYGYFYTTKEFEAGLDHGWGKCTFVFGF